MKKIFIIGVVAILFAHCSETEFPSKHYPYVVMKETNTSGEGVALVAEFKALGNTPIKRFGFLWWQGNNAMDSSDYYFREIESQAGIGNFSLTVASDLEDGKVYQVRPFAENAQTIVVGNVFVFTSMGTKSPEMEDFFPKSGGPGDIITITGSNFSLSKTRIEVFIGIDKCIVVSTDANEIQFQLPADLSTSGEVPLSLKSGNVTLKADDPFLVEGHVIADFNPKQGIIGETEIVISGNSFLETGNVVRIGDYDAVILQESKTQIKIRLPYEMKIGVLPVKVDVNGQVATASDLFTVKSRWVRLANFPGAPRLNPFYTIVGNSLYVIGGETNTYSDEVWKYDIANDSWLRLSNFPGGGRAGGVGFAIGTMIYYGLGAGSGGIDDFWSFNTLTGQWKETYSLESVEGPPLTTSINGIGYLLGGGSFNNYSFTSQGGWKYLGAFPNFDIRMMYDSYFEIGGDLYLLDMVTNNNTGQKFYNLRKGDRLDPTSWELVNTFQPFPKKSYNAICFVSNNGVYIGEGAHSVEDRKFIKLDVTTNQWTQIENFQGPVLIRSCMSFSHNNKGYVGFGMIRHQGPDVFSSNQIWVYDPSIE